MFSFMGMSRRKPSPRSLTPFAARSSRRSESSAGAFTATLDRWRNAIERGGLGCLKGLILETAAAAPGGTGVANDWRTIIEAKRAGAFDALPPLIAAGGLTPETVAAVIRDVAPYAVDVSSGIETVRREKSFDRMKAFVEAVRRADEGARATRT